QAAIRFPPAAQDYWRTLNPERRTALLRGTRAPRGKSARACATYRDPYRLPACAGILSLRAERAVSWFSETRQYCAMLTGAHSIIYSTNADADRAFLRDVLALPNVDVGHGWLIFGLPPAEVAVHPSDKNNIKELYFMCDDIQAFVARMTAHVVECEPVKDQGWGLLT